MKYGYEESVKLLGEQLAATADIPALCRRTGSRLAEGEPPAIILAYLNRQYRIAWPEISFSFVDSDEAVPLKDKVLILHYLATARGTALEERQITFRDVPDGGNYYDVFFKRAIRPVVNRFGDDPGALLAAAAGICARREDMGDAAVTVDAFPMVPLTWVLWRGDDEFPADGSVLLDASVSDYLSSYAITELCEVIAWSLVRLAGKN